MDDRIAINRSEMVAAKDELRKQLVAANAPDSLTNQMSDAEKWRESVVEHVLRAINAKRLGYFEGSVARHGDGRIAKRYFDTAANQLSWLVFENDTDQVAASRVEDLVEPGWRILHSELWKVTRD